MLVLSNYLYKIKRITQFTVTEWLNDWIGEDKEQKILIWEARISEFLGILIRKNNVVDSFPIDWLTNLFFQL